MHALVICLRSSPAGGLDSHRLDKLELLALLHLLKETDVIQAGLVKLALLLLQGGVRLWQETGVSQSEGLLESKMSQTGEAGG